MQQVGQQDRAENEKYTPAKLVAVLELDQQRRVALDQQAVRGQGLNRNEKEGVDMSEEDNVEREERQKAIAALGGTGEILGAIQLIGTFVRDMDKYRDALRQIGEGAGMLFAGILKIVTLMSGQGEAESSDAANEPE